MTETIEPTEHPDQDCLKCYQFLEWNADLGCYVDEEGLALCHPQGGIGLDNLSHTPGWLGRDKIPRKRI
jgi:hypothetical protein